MTDGRATEGATGGTATDLGATARPEVPALGDLGPNVGLVEELYRRYVEDPSSVAPSWRELFEDRPGRAPVEGATVPAPGASSATPPATSTPAPTPASPVADTQPEILRGARARTAQNMVTSLAVPTATSVRPVPAKLLEVNRQILNNHLARGRGGKVSFTHLIGYALVRALADVPAMHAAYADTPQGPGIVHHPHVNLGLAVDLTRSDGTRTLLVPSIKGAETLDFHAFFRAYEELIRRVRSGAVTPEDLAGTTLTLTNPGTIGTVHSVPRLMPGQGVIIGVGAIAYPAEYEGADPEALARMGVSKVVTLTSTYDHRIIQGAQSGELLAKIHDVLLGAGGFYDDVFAAMGVPYEPVRWRTDVNAEPGSEAADAKQAGVHRVINMYRVRGHLLADLDPLGRAMPTTHPELDPATYGLTLWDLDRQFATGGLAGRERMPLREILSVLRDAYSRTIGVEYMHIQEPGEKAWIRARVEGAATALGSETKHRILERLNAAEALERFLHTKYVGHKRFSLEGAESLVPMLDALLTAAVEDGVEHVVMGMAHRGRLNVLANILGKSYGQIFREFEGDLDPSSIQGSGDVKYHLGACGTHAAPSGSTLEVTLASNPSHLEAVDPVVVGMARARQDRLGDPEGRRVLALLVHGDAAFAGQGVVAETLNLSGLEGYGVGGTVHVVVNNQLGFTTSPEHGRSSVYATDVAKMVQAPIFHVNGDDPEACVRVIRLALAFRQAFHRDVVVDLVCFRRYGHNEADEPAYTQPRMYARIQERQSVRKRYTETLVDRGDISLQEAEQALDDFRARLERAFAETKDSAPPPAEPGAPTTTAPRDHADGGPRTAVGRDQLDRLAAALASVPEGFRVHPKLERQILGRRESFDAGIVDWALAESLAFGALVLDGVPVRAAGQDTRRGTFSQRHAVLVDFDTEAEHIPLASLDAAQAPFMIYDSLLSEYAALAFEYGYSVVADDALTCWEAQFGDFANGAQIVIDQFLAAADEKWSQPSGLVLLLPHGFEGQGPEHSSARLERFLTLCARGNLRVTSPTTAAQHFHLLRRQALDPLRRPLVVLTPKRYLRMPATRSAVDDLVGGAFHAVLDDPAAGPDLCDAASRVVLCTGKVAHELVESRDKRGAPVAIVRLEQLYPFPALELAAVLGRYRAAREVVWAQEEPENMGAWSFVHARLHAHLRDLDPSVELRHVARPESGSPATGSQAAHEREHEALLDAALA